MRWRERCGAREQCVVISSRTPEGDRNRCPICRHRCRIEPSCLTPDAPCPRCGHLLWFPIEEEPTPKPVTALASSEPLKPPQASPVEVEPEIPANRPKRYQGRPTARKPEVQASRLVARLVRRAEKRLGSPGRAIDAELTAVSDPQQVERLLSLLYLAKSWGELMSIWRAERVSSN